MGSLSPVHWMIVLGVLVLLFGSSKLPQMARSMGQSARILRAEARGMHDDEQAASSASPPAQDSKQLNSGTAAPASSEASQRTNSTQ